MLCTWVQVLVEARRGHLHPRAGFTGTCEVPDLGARNQSTEPSLQPLHFVFKTGQFPTFPPGWLRRCCFAFHFLRFEIFQFFVSFYTQIMPFLPNGNLSKLALNAFTNIVTVFYSFLSSWPGGFLQPSCICHPDLELVIASRSFGSFWQEIYSERSIWALGLFIAASLIFLFKIRYNKSSYQ